MGSVATSGTDSVTIDSTTVFALTLEGSGESSMYTARVVEGIQSTDSMPLNYVLSPNYPNPFNESTTIEFTMKDEGYATLKVYDLLGREIETLAQGTYSRGVHQFQWNSDGMASGVYYYKFTAGSYTETRSMILVR